MARTEATLRKFGVTQYLEPEYWKWPDEWRAHLATATAEQIVQAVVQRLETGGEVRVSQAYGIVHDKDEREVWDPVTGAMVKEFKPRHVHMLVHYENGMGATLTETAGMIGVEPQYVDKPQKGPHAWDNMLSYLCHCKYPDKHHYAPTEVATVRGPDFMGIYAERSPLWHKAQALMINRQVKEDLEDVRRRVIEGDLTREQIMLTDDLYAVYSRHSSVLDDALAAANQRKALKAAAKLRAGEFSTRVVFVTGPSGSGKTWWAMNSARAAVAAAERAGQRWAIYRAATTNPLDDWAGEEVILLDDLRAASMTATEWLLLLDPHNANPASARYRNKAAVAPRLVIITASISPIEFFFYARQRGEVDEALDQFMRRLSAIVEVVESPVDAERYIWQLVGRTALPEQRTISHRPNGWGSRTTVSVNHGPINKRPMSDTQAVDELLTLLDSGCKDLSLTNVIEGEVIAGGLLPGAGVE